MIKYQINLNYRFSSSYGPEQLIQLLNTVVDQIGFDDSTPFEMVLENQNHERHISEISITELSEVINQSVWPALHQLLLSNHWMKDMNLKFHLVKRQDHITVTIKCDLDDVHRRQSIEDKIEAFLVNQEDAEKISGPNLQELEAQFGAMLLSEHVAEKTRTSFLAGDWQGCLKIAVALITKSMVEKTKVDETRYFEVINLLTQDVPCLLLPDLSGDRLREELGGLAHLIVGSLSLMQPLIESKSQPITEPARVLKYLVLTSIILERLENTIINPAYGADQKIGRATKASPTQKAPAKKTNKVIKKQKTKTTQIKKAQPKKSKSKPTPKFKKTTKKVKPTLKKKVNKKVVKKVTKKKKISKK